MLAYLEELCTALLAHDALAIHRLLAHPLARSLPRQVREEAIAISRASPTSLRAPIHTLRFYHQTLQLGDDDPGPGRSADEPADTDSDSHMDARQGDVTRPSGNDMRDIVRDAESEIASREDARSDIVPREQMELPLPSLDCAAA